MGSIAVIEATVDSTISTGSFDSDFVDVVTTENLVEGKVYHVICSGITSTGDADNLFGWRLYDETNSEAVDGSTLTREMAQAGQPQPYYFVGRITAGATTGGLAFQQKGYPITDPVVGYEPARTEFLSLLLLDMSAMNAADYFYANDDSSQLDSGWATKVQYTETEIEEGDKWLVFAGIETSINSTTRYTEARINYTATYPDRAPKIKFEGKNTGESLLWWMCRSYNIHPDDAGGSVTWAFQARSTGTGDNSYTQNATLFGIKLSSLTDSFNAYAGSSPLPTDTEFIEIESDDFTPTNSGKVIVAATTISDAGGSFRKAGQRIQRKVTTIPNDVPDTLTFLNTNDASEELPLSYITAFDGVSGQGQVMAYDARVGTYYAGVTFKQSTLAIFGTTTFVPLDNFTAIAKQVYTSGDVASETLVAGSRATQTLASGDVEAQGFTSGDKVADTNASGDVAGEVNPE